jgi:YD repeat-containing protein
VPSGPVTIDYAYDPLYRLKEANYSTGDYYHYTYDAVGNRLTEDSSVDGLPSSVAYTYDNANRLTSVDGIAYTFDANGNLLNDGVNTYTYDSANRLTSVSGPSSVVSYSYNGLGDRLSQTVDGNTTNYVLDLNAGLTQVVNCNDVGCT